MKKTPITVQDREGDAVAGAEVYVREGGGSLATIYSDNGVTATTNPLTTDNDGYAQFYVADGTYTIQIYVEGVQQREITGYQIFDDTDNEIAALRSVTSAADKGFYFTGSGTGSTYDLSSFVRTFSGSADAAAARTALGLGTIATEATGDYLAAANNLSDLADASTARTNLSAASTSQTAEQISGFIASPSDKSYTIAVKMAHAGTITETTTISASGTCTATFKIGSNALGGTANSVSSVEDSQSHASSNSFSAGDDIVLTVSSNSSCADMSFTIKYTRTLS